MTASDVVVGNAGGVAALEAVTSGRPVIMFKPIAGHGRANAARRNPWGSGSLWLALACGADFGVTAFLLKLVPDTLPQGFTDPLRQWPLYLCGWTRRSPAGRPTWRPRRSR